MKIPKDWDNTLRGRIALIMKERLKKTLESYTSEIVTYMNTNFDSLNE